jgi:hypothetical protein
MIGIRTYGLIVVALVASSMISPAVFHPAYGPNGFNTEVRLFYYQSEKVQPHQVLEDQRVSDWSIGNGITIVAIHATISALPDLNVQIWLWIPGRDKFFPVNSGSLGTANADISGIALYVEPNAPLALGFWCDNLSDTVEDFHASITIFYVNS